MTSHRRCIIALDLGTSAFKSAWVDENGNLGPVTAVRYKLDHENGRVTCPPSRYLRAALHALRRTAQSAIEHGVQPEAIGITSQAQTFLTLDPHGSPIGPAIVWTDSTAIKEAEGATAALPDFAVTSGFSHPSPLQFLPKVMRQQCAPLSHSDGRGVGGEGAVPRSEGTVPNGRAGVPSPPLPGYLLLNEWLIYRLTGTPIGDTCNQGMGGFWDISKNAWNERSLALAGVSRDQLACVGPPGQRSARLLLDMQKRLDLPELPVYSCANDNTAAAAGARIASEGDLLCSFGTATVVYGLTIGNVIPRSDHQIAGIGPWPGTGFLLAVTECGSVLDWLAGLLHRGKVDRMMEDALAPGVDPTIGPRLCLSPSGRFDLHGLDLSNDRRHIARAALEYYADRFGELLADVSNVLGKPRRLIAGGGLSRSRPWLDLLERHHGVKLETCSTEHPTLLGVARIIKGQPK